MNNRLMVTFESVFMNKAEVTECLDKMSMYPQIKKSLNQTNGITFGFVGMYIFKTLISACSAKIRNLCHPKAIWKLKPLLLELTDHGSSLYSMPICLITLVTVPSTQHPSNS